MYAYELMKLAAENPQKYEGKKYRIAAHFAHTSDGMAIKEFVIKDKGLAAEGNLRVYVSESTEVKEIPQPVPFMDAANSGKKIRPIKPSSASHNYFYRIQTWLCVMILNLDEINGLWEVES